MDKEDWERTQSSSWTGSFYSCRFAEPPGEDAAKDDGASRSVPVVVSSNPSWWPPSSVRLRIQSANWSSLTDKNQARTEKKASQIKKNVIKTSRLRINADKKIGGWACAKIIDLPRGPDINYMPHLVLRKASTMQLLLNENIQICLHADPYLFCTCAQIL